MATRGLSRKRPAPESPPMQYQQPTGMAQPINGYSAAVGPQLSDEQFLQWGQTAQPPNQYSDPAYYQSMNSAAPSNAQGSNQLTRRPINQVATRPKQLENANNMWVDANGGNNGAFTQQQLDTASSDDIEELKRRAAIAKRDAEAKRKQIPPFVQKLSSFLEKNENMDLIRWSDDGNSFIVLDEDEFAKTLIPDLFKHNNYASFVRQLNMYGFHKKVGLSDNSMRASERKNKSPSEYSNPYFRSGHPELLWLIQKPKSATATKGKGRKAGSEQNDEDADEYTRDTPNMDHHMQSRTQLANDHSEAALPPEKFQIVQRELAAIRRQQQQITSMMAQLKREHEQLYSQAANFQDQHTRHENSINAILTFLATVYSRSLNGNEGASGIAGLFANSAQHDANQGNVVDVGDYAFEGLNGNMFGKPYKNAPLLLQGPPSDRAATASPNPESATYQPRMTRRSSQALQQGVTPVTTGEQAFESNAPTPFSPYQHPLAERDGLLGFMQSQNARSIPSTSADFSDVLNSLENNGGKGPLSQLERASMLRMINDTAGQSGDNALINATPPPMPQGYSRNLQQSKASQESLARLQADVDKRMQNVTEILTVHSPTGSIPGLDDGQLLPPPPLDIDNFLNQDYYNDFPSDGAGNYDFIGAGGTQGSFNANEIPNADDGNDDDELFADIPPNGHNALSHEDYPINEDGTGRVESIASSEVTTPNTNSTADANGYGPQTRSSTQGRRMSGELEKSPGKRRKTNV